MSAASASSNGASSMPCSPTADATSGLWGDSMVAVVTLFAVAASLTGCSGGGSSVSAPPSTRVEEPRGYFALTTRTLSATQKAELVSNPAIAGMTSYVTWNDIEPTKGQFDWSRIDSDIAIAAAAGKKITIGVFTGRNAIPPWAAGDGVRLWTNSAGTTLVHPADRRFVDLWRERAAFLGARYDDSPTVVQVTICGAVGTLCGPRYPQVPSDLAYADLVRNWSDIIDAYVGAFPRTYLNLEVHLTDGYGAQLPIDLFATIAPNTAIGPFAEFLSDIQPSPTAPTGIAFQSIKASRSFCAFQMVSALADRVDRAILLGQSYGCRYSEIYASDVTSHSARFPPN